MLKSDHFYQFIFYTQRTHEHTYDKTYRGNVTCTSVRKKQLLTCYVFFLISKNMIHISLFFNQETNATTAKRTPTHENSTANTENDVLVSEKLQSRTVNFNSTLSKDINTLSTEASTGRVKVQSRTTNDTLLVFINLIGCVDIILLCLYFAVCMYDRRHRTLQTIEINNAHTGNNTLYENIEIFFLPPTGNNIS